MPPNGNDRKELSGCACNGPSRSCHTGRRVTSIAVSLVSDACHNAITSDHTIDSMADGGAMPTFLQNHTCLGSSVVSAGQASSATLPGTRRHDQDLRTLRRGKPPHWLLRRWLPNKRLLWRRCLRNRRCRRRGLHNQLSRSCLRRLLRHRSLRRRRCLLSPMAVEPSLKNSIRTRPQKHTHGPLWGQATMQVA